MNSEFAEVAGIVLTYSIFGILGYRLSNRFRLPVSVLAWVVLVLATILAIYQGIDVRLIAIDRFAIQLNYGLQSLFFGIVIGLLVRTIRFQKNAKPA